MTQSFERAVMANATLLRERNTLRRENAQLVEMAAAQAATIEELRRRIRDHEHPDIQTARALEHKAFMAAVNA